MDFDRKQVEKKALIWYNKYTGFSVSMVHIKRWDIQWQM